MKKREDFVISQSHRRSHKTTNLVFGTMVAVFGLCATVGYAGSVLAEEPDPVEFSVLSSAGPVTGGQTLDVVGSGLSDYVSQTTFSGQSVTLPADSTVEEFVLTGETVQSGAGNPSPTNYRPFDTSNAYVDADGVHYDMGIQLYGQSSIGSNDVATLYDEADMLTGSVTRRLAMYTIKGTETVSYVSSTNAFEIKNAFNATNRPKGQMGDLSLTKASHYTSSKEKAKGIPDMSLIIEGTDTWSNIVVKDSRFGADPDALKAYLAAQYAAGTPVTIVYELATPITETIPVSNLPTSIDNDSIFTSNGNMNIVATLSKPASVSLDNQTCADPTVIDDSELTCTVPPARKAGLVDVSIALGNGKTVTLANSYEYVDTAAAGATLSNDTLSTGSQKARAALVPGTPSTGFKWTK